MCSAGPETICCLLEWTEEWQEALHRHTKFKVIGNILYCLSLCIILYAYTGLADQVIISATIYHSCPLHREESEAPSNKQPTGILAWKNYKPGVRIVVTDHSGYPTTSQKPGDHFSLLPCS